MISVNSKTLNQQQSQQYKQQIYLELTDNILPFWQTAADHKLGGFVDEMAINGVINRKANKSVIAHARILWSFSRAFSALTKPQYLVQANQAFAFLMTHFIDKTFAGAYYTLSHDGEVVNDDKDIVAQAYVVFALSAYYRASQNTDALKYAQSITALIELNALDSQSGFYNPCLNRQWQNKTANKASNKLSPNTQVHIHLIEAYSELLTAHFDPQLAQSLSNLLKTFTSNFINPLNHHVIQGCDNTSQIHGHNLEVAWLLADAAKVLGEPNLIEKCSKIGLHLIDQLISLHATSAHSTSNRASSKGISFGVKVNQLIDNAQDDQREGWIQAEAVTALCWAWQHTQNPLYLQWLFGTWQYIIDFMKDNHKGEWYSGRYADGRLVADQLKIGPWKCPYHSVRACLHFYHLLKPAKKGTC